jgi:hypothetical protein
MPCYTVESLDAMHKDQGKLLEVKEISRRVADGFENALARDQTSMLSQLHNQDTI